MNKFPSRLIALRKEKGLTQENLAKILCRKRSTISGYETEGKEPDFETLCILANYFNVSTDYLLGFSDCRSNTDDVLYCDNVNFKKHYDALPAELKIIVARLYDDFYVMLTRDIQTKNSGRLSVYAELFRTLREARSDIKKCIESPNSNMQNPIYLSEVMTLQNNLKNNISAILDQLMQADLETAFDIKKGISEELSIESAT